MSRTQSVPFFPKSGNLFSPSCSPVSVAEHASIFLNTPKYPWKWFSKLFWLCQGCEDTCSSYMFGRLLKMPPVLTTNCCICQGYEEFQICLIMAPYVSITPEYAPICLNMTEYSWMYEYPWICLNKLFLLCQGSENAAI